MIDGLWYVLLSEMMVNIAAAGFIAAAVTAVGWNRTAFAERDWVVLAVNLAVGLGALLLGFAFRKLAL